MSVEKRRIVLLNLNRLLIYFFGLLGIFFDLTWAYVVSMTLWVWLPSCIRYECQIFSHWFRPTTIKPHHAHSGHNI